jgi:Delta3-Delta2-enoyl-CoA isomerase
MMTPVPALDRDGEIFILHLGDDGSLFTPQLLGEISALIEEVAAAPAPRALVTAAAGKAWALGLDLEWIANNRDGVGELVVAMHELDARVLELPVPTVAAIGGHAFAGGALLALAHDFRVMRSDRGFFCLPEIDGQIAFTLGLTALVRSRLPPQTAHEALTTGRRYGGPEALTGGIVDHIASEEAVLEKAVSIAASLAPKHPGTLGQIKRTLYHDTLLALRDRDSYSGDASPFKAAIDML